MAAKLLEREFMDVLMSQKFLLYSDKRSSEKASSVSVDSQLPSASIIHMPKWHILGGIV